MRTKGTILSTVNWHREAAQLFKPSSRDGRRHLAVAKALEAELAGSATVEDTIKVLKEKF